MFTPTHSNPLVRTPWGSLLFSAAFILLLSIAPTAQAQIFSKCTYKVNGNLEAKHTQAYKDFLGTTRSSLEGVQVRVQGKKLVAGGGIWGTWNTVRTNANGRFGVTKEKGCGKRRVRVQVKFKDSDLEVRHKTATSSVTKVKWYTVYQTTSGTKSGLNKDKTLTFRSSGNRALGQREPRYHADIWSLYQEAIARMGGYGSRLAFQSRIKVKYPHNHISSSGVSYANPVNKVIYLVKNSNVNHDGGENPEVALHELMHIWAYQHSRNEGLVGTYFIGQTINNLVGGGDGELTHGVVNEKYVAFHEGFAEWAAEFLKPRIGPQSRTKPWSPSFLRGYSNGIPDFGNIEYADRGWYNIFSLMQAPRPWEFNFNTGGDNLSRTNTTPSDIIPFKNCSVGQLGFRELLNTIDRNGQQDISTGDMNWLSFSSRVASQSNGVNRSDVRAYKTMLDPSSSRQEILKAMCTEGEEHTVVIKGNGGSGASTTYTVEASRAIKQVDGSLGGRTVTIQSGDQDNGATATGRVSSGADGFRLAGDIKEITLDTPDAATVYVDGKEYHTVVITSKNDPGGTTYTLKASDDLAQVSGTLDGKTVSIQQNDQVNGATGTGEVNRAADGFVVTGTLREIRLDNPEAATVYVDDGGSLGGGAPLQAYATRRVGGNGTADFGRTGADVQFQGTSGSATVSVMKLANRPSGTRGIPRSNVSDYRFVFDTVGNLSFGTNTEVRFEVGTLGGVGDPSNVTVYKRPTEGTGSFSPLTTSVDAGRNELVATTGSFSEFVLGSDRESLPVELARFEATPDDSNVRLKWKTASETGNAGFRVQRKRAGESSDWTTIGRRDGAGTTTQTQSYRFTDSELPFEADSLSYRLRQVDVDGSVQYSDPIVVSRKTVNEARLLDTYPNPARRRATVRFAIPDEAAGNDATLELYDVLGQRVRSVGLSQQTGRQKQKVDVSGLSSGVYFLRLRAAGATKTQRLTVVQ